VVVSITALEGLYERHTSVNLFNNDIRCAEAHHAQFNRVMASGAEMVRLDNESGFCQLHVEQRRRMSNRGLLVLTSNRLLW